MKLRTLQLAALATLLSAARVASSTEFTLDQVTTVVTPITQGSANTTFFGWDVFDATNPIDDSTPDLGTTSVGVNFKTLNNENHRSGSGNIYIDTNETLSEQITVATIGTVGTTGTTTIIAQFVTAFGDFPNSPISMSAINGVLPTVVRGVNAAGKGQVWAKWVLPGNAASYVFTINGLNTAHAFSIDRIVVDTHWSNSTPQPDTMVAKSPPTFKMDQEATVVAPTSRGGANTTYFGWDTFCEVGFDNVPINDTTPDIGTTTTGVSFVTTNGEDHISSSRNLYVGFGTLSEEVTVVTDGVVGSGFTTIIAQAVTAFGGFPNASLTFGSIAGVAPEVVQTTNIAGKGQVWAKWKVPGNEASYTFTVTGPTGVSGWSFDKFVVDTQWSATAYQTDVMSAGNPAQSFTMEQTTDVVKPSSRGNANTTWFGWEVFTNPAGNAVDPINDTTPDIGTTTTGPSIVTQNGQDHLSSTNNIYLGTNGMTLDELVTVTTNAPPGTPASGTNSGSTTIIAQAIAQAGAIRTPIHFGSINGIAPTVVTATNAAGKGQIWAKWVIPGNPSNTYTFNITSDIVTGPATSISIDRLVVDTAWRLSGSQPDTMRARTPPNAHVLNQVTDVVTPSSRGNVQTTHFGWEAFNDVGNRNMGVSVIDDSTPDIGYTTTAGARFRTTNGEGHVLSSGNLYFLSGTLAEQITVPTNGTVGSGFTTVILQIASATGSPVGGDGGFAGDITLTIAGAPPTSQIVGSNSAGAAQLWAKWEVPGNAATYDIVVAGPPSQAHFSFDRVVVDTFWNATSYLGDSMAAEPPAISTASPLAVAGIGLPYSATLASEGGTAPYAYSLSAGALPDGLALSAAGEITGEATTEGTGNFTVLVTDTNGLTATKAFSIQVTTSPDITTGELELAVAGVSYSQTFAATGGTTPYEWSVSDGSLPTGLTLNATTGELSGTVNAAGTSNFTIQVTDANELVATEEYELTFFDLTITTASPLAAGVVNVGYSLTFGGSGGTAPYAWDVVSGALPAGLTLDDSGLLSGTPTGAGDNTFTIELTDNDGFTVTKEFTLTVHSSFQTPAINPPAFGTTTIGAPYTYNVIATNYPKTFTITGLPKGLTYSKTTGFISGRPLVQGVFIIQVKAANVGGTSLTVSSPLVVRPLARNLMGRFLTVVGRDATANANLGSLIDITTTGVGSFTGRVMSAGRTTAIRGALAASAPQIQITVSGQSLALSIDPLTGAVTGTHGAATAEGWRLVWNATNQPAYHLAGYYSFSLDLSNPADDGQLNIPQGSGFATFTVAPAGTLIVKGKTADGQTITTSGFVGPDGEIAIYTSLYKNKGSVVGVLTLGEDPTGLYADNEVTGDLTWLKPVDTGKAYAAGFGPTELEAEGRYLATAPEGQIIMGLPEVGAADLLFTDGGLASSITDPDVTGFTYTDKNTVVMPAVNPGKTKLTINKNTGIVSGEFTLQETAPPLKRVVKFSGQIVRPAAGDSKAIGFFLLPQIGGATVLSGGVLVEQ
jgi:hypothetical protein